jgi:hypothetical protein
MTQRHTLILLTFLILLAFALRVLSLDAQSMWRDEIDTFCFSRDFWKVLRQATGEQVTPVQPLDPQAARDGVGDAASSLSLDRPRCQPTPGLARIDPGDGLLPTLRALLTMRGWNGSLYTIAVRPWIVLTGHSPFALRFGSLFFGLLAVPLTYVLGRRLLGTMVGLAGAALVALSPHLVWYSQEAKMYAVILALALLALYGLRRALDGGGGRWWGLTVVATTLALYNHVLAALLIPLQVVLGLVWWPRLRRRWRGALVALACLTLPYLPLLAWQVHDWLLPQGQATLFTLRRLDVMLEATFNGWGGNFVGEPWATRVLVGLGLLALCGLTWTWLADGRGRWREPSALLTWMLLPLLGIWLISTRQPIFTNRYLVWAAPAFYLLAASGVVALAGRGRAGVLVSRGVLALVLVGNGYALHHQATQPIKPDFRAAAAYLDERYQPGDLVVFHLSYMQHNFDFYFEDDYKGWGAPAPGEGMSEDDLDFHMRTNTSGYETVWLVLSEAEMWDPQGRVKAWLDAQAVTAPQVRILAYVGVYGYRMGD